MITASETFTRSDFVGVVGGMGPAATARFYEVLVSATPADRDQDHIPVVIWADPRIPDRSAALLGVGDSPLPYLLGITRTLVDVGAALLAMPCNTAHVYLADLRAAASPVPFVDIVEESMRSVRRVTVAPALIAVFATRGTLRAGLYQSALEAAGSRVVLPSDRQQEQVDNAIAGVKRGTFGEAAACLRQVAGELEQEGVDAILAACTELAIGFGSCDMPLPVIDSGASLAAGVVSRFRDVCRRGVQAE